MMPAARPPFPSLCIELGTTQVENVTPPVRFLITLSSLVSSAKPGTVRMDSCDYKGPLHPECRDLEKLCEKAM